jgi:hypothetical protein
MSTYGIRLLILSIYLLGIGGFSQSAQNADYSAADTKAKLKAFEMGKLSLDDLSALPNICDDLANFYFAHTNEVTTKMKLPISRCFAALKKYSEAATLASDYVAVYSNDWHGWRIVGGAKLMLKSYEDALAALTNAVRLGDEGNYVAVGLAAIPLKRVDVLKSMVVPHLLELKDSGEISHRLDMIGILVVYALLEGREDVFIKALEGLKSEDIKYLIAREDNVKESVMVGWKQFHPKKVKSLCEEIERQMKHTSTPGNKE